MLPETSKAKTSRAGSIVAFASCVRQTVPASSTPASRCKTTAASRSIKAPVEPPAPGRPPPPSADEPPLPVPPTGGELLHATPRATNDHRKDMQVLRLIYSLLIAAGLRSLAC